MSPRPSPRLKSTTRTPTGPRAAVPAGPRAVVGEPKGAACKGVPSALRSAPHPVTVSGITPGLQVRLTSPPVADWLCSCGHHERARGRTAVIELTTRVRVGTCPHTDAAHEGRNAA